MLYVIATLFSFLFNTYSRWAALFVLLEVGPGFGYYPNPRKSSIVVGPAS